jgi:5-methylcytosine-specific restriction endonuclease McrA
VITGVQPTKPCPQGHVNFKVMANGKRRCIECDKLTAARLRQRNREYIDEQKRKPCADCGGAFPTIAMDFDHVNDDKVQGVARMMRTVVALAALQREIDKCELVCSNCHRVRTYTRRVKLWGRDEDLSAKTQVRR